MLDQIESTVNPFASTALSDADLAAMVEDLNDGIRAEAAIADADLIAMEYDHANRIMADAIATSQACADRLQTWVDGMKPAEHAACGWMTDVELDRAMLRYPEGYGLGLAVEYHATTDSPYHPYLHDYKSPDSRVYLGAFPTHAAAVAAGVAAARKMAVDKLRAVRSINHNDVPASARTLRARQPWRYDAAGKGRAA